jgi:hypothetical protein
MSTDARKTAYSVGKAAAKFAPGYITGGIPPKAGSCRITPPALLQAAHCQLDSIPIIDPGSGPALARLSGRSAVFILVAEQLWRDRPKAFEQ